MTKKSGHNKWIHVLLWGVMLLYLFIAPAIKDRLTLVYGKPSELAGVTLTAAGTIHSSIDKLELVKVDRQTLYRLSGWSFLETDKKQARFDIYLVLRSNHDTYYFSTSATASPDLETAYPAIISDLSNSGFDADIAPATLHNGTYAIGFLYINQKTGERFYQESNRQLVKSITGLKLAK